MRSLSKDLIEAEEKRRVFARATVLPKPPTALHYQQLLIKNNLPRLLVPSSVACH